MLVDSGEGQKLERFGRHLIARPCSQAVWPKSRRKWSNVDATFSREEGMGWEGKLPKQWTIEVSGIRFKISPTDFGHLGIFPEQKAQWEWIRETLQGKKASVLNLFAYSGGSTLAAAQAGAEVCHLDASKGMVAWARENAALNNLEKAPIRWIIDDARKFIDREIRRGRRYDAIILDPPTFGRGAKGEFFKIELEINALIESCRKLLSETPLFVLLSCHTPGFSPTVLENLLQPLGKGTITSGEMVLEGEGLPLPSGTYARWEAC